MTGRPSFTCFLAGTESLLVQCAADSTIQVFNFNGRSLTAAGSIKVSGAPTGIRTAGTR